jgi:hypothetical protein
MQVVSNDILKSATCVNGVTLEALLAQEIEHPYIVRTYKCLVRSYEAGERQFAGTMTARNSANCGNAYRTPSDCPPGCVTLPSATPSAQSTLPGGQRYGMDSERMSQAVRPSDAGRTFAAITDGGLAAESLPTGCGDDGGDALAAGDLPRAMAAKAVAPPEAPPVVAAGSVVAPVAPAVSVEPAGAPIPALGCMTAEGAAAPPAPAGDFDSFNACSEEVSPTGVASARYSCPLRVSYVTILP